MNAQRILRTWFSLFLKDFSPEQTEAEVAFVDRHISRDASVLDLCCGPGRHARMLAAGGHRVLGVDRSEPALAGENEEYRELNMRDLDELPGSFDAAICLWQSFGYFDDATNLGVLHGIADKLVPGGRFVLDIYHRGFFERHGGARRFVRNGVAVTESREMRGRRLTVNLDYEEAGAPDNFEWQLYTPEEMRELGREAGLRLLVCCADFDEEVPAAPEKPRMQLVFGKGFPKAA